MLHCYLTNRATNAVIPTKRLYVLLFFILGNSSVSEASILSATEKFLKLHDKILVESQKLGLEQVDFFADICRSSGLRDPIGDLRMSHSMLTCRDQPSPMTTRVLLSQNEQGVEQVGISIEMQVSLASVAAAITHRCTLDKAFSELDTKARSEIENELKMLLIQIRTIISGYEPFIKLCANFNLSKELKDTIELIDESVKDISESTTRP